MKCINNYQRNIYIYIYIYTNTNTETKLPVNVIVTLPNPQSEDSQVQQMFLAPSADNQAQIYII